MIMTTSDEIVPAPRLIETDAALRTYCESLRDTAWLGVDTEFLRVNTYYPQLCLVQLANADSIVLLDPVKIGRLDPLRRVLADSGIVKIVHAARQDLEVLVQHGVGLPVPIFDTQLAAAFCGHGEQLSYAHLAQSVCGITLAKSETRTNWCERPLRPAQIHYAADDVRYLGALYESLQAELVAGGKLDWLQQECALLAEPDQYKNPPEFAYRRLKRGQSLDVAAQHRLSRLAEWRERTAQRIDLPREWVLPNAALFDIAGLESLDVAALKQIDSLRPRQRGRWGEELIAALRDAGGDGSPLWPDAGRLSARQTDLRRRLTTLVQHCTQQYNMSASLLATRQDLDRLILGDRTSAVLHGWRRAAIGDALLAALEDQPEPPMGSPG